MDDLGLYLHVPFCLRKCAYCSFYSEAGHKDSRHWLAAVTRQIRQFSSPRPLTSIFFGGGTPTMLPPEELSSLLAECRQSFSCAEEAEISLEANPATVDLLALQTLRQTGFNRLSLGVQSLHDAELRRLGRPHTAAEAVQTARLARQAGFTNLNLDLMYGLPNQTQQSWRETLAQALALRPQHLSIYELTIEEGTPFARQQEQGELALPDEDTVLRMLEATQQMTEAAGFRRYEISNYAQPDFECRHNINYWRNGDYIGIGPGAVSCVDGTRRSAAADVAEFCRRMENGQNIWTDEEHLEPEAAFRESVVIGLRMTDGVSLDELHRRFGIDAAAYYGATLERLISLGMLELADGRLRLTAQGLLLANAVMADLV
ncbi:radical SAM family heme chaperone HemW [Candidatus Electronema sp. JC]|uniref:radical SAM family heme chaperone HemW n=1 Tax=Candidatus Electronema sp. JC TaxID=3401570 RepID=UPI003AA95B5C